MKKALFVLVLVAGSLVSQSQSQSVWTNVKDKGADATGNTKCTKVISDIITELSAKGGGTVFFPAGTFLTGPIIMKSNINLWLDAGAVVKFSDDFDDYLPMVPSRWEDVRVRNFVSQIYDMKMEIKQGSALEAKDSKQIFWDKVSVKSPLTDQPLLKLANCSGVNVTNCYQPEQYSPLISEDEKTENIIIANNIFPGTSLLTNGKGKNVVAQFNIIKK